MGLFSFLDPIVKPIEKIAKQVLPVVATGGLSLVSKDVKRLATRVTDPLASAFTNPQTALSLLPQTRGFVGATSLLPGIPKNAGGPMALDVGGILRTVGGIFGGGQNPIFQGISDIATLGAQFVPSSPVSAIRPGQHPRIEGPMRAMPRAMVGRGFFTRFPNLALVIQQWRDRGVKVTRSQLWSMLKRWGPEVLVSGGIITAAAVSELMLAGPGRRRMNPGNVKALRRSMRRVEGFHRLCVQADRLRRPRTRRGTPAGRGSQQFVRQG